MQIVSVAQRVTAEEYLAREDLPRFTNLVEGEIIVASPRVRHQTVCKRLFLALGAWEAAAPERGEVNVPLDVGLDEHNVYAPDLLWYRAGRAPAVDADPPYPLPDLAVEVRSPATWRFDVGAKKTAYERHGLPELWLVDTAAEEMLLFRRSTPRVRDFDVALQLARGDTLTSPLLAGFAADVDGLFPAPSR
jgi:Uma2 family endonuclease